MGKKSFFQNRRSNSEKSIRTPRLRLTKVITEMHEFQNRTENELVIGIKTEARELAWFFGLFVVYVLFGAFVFFYIEECSGASMVDDGSTPSLYDKLTWADFKHVNNTCYMLYTESLISLTNFTSTSNATLWSNTSYNRFIVTCSELLTSSLRPIVTSGYHRNCVADEFQILKYAEFTIFTLLTVGYGNTTPVTIIGRYILVFYAIIGVPIAVTMYSVAGKLLVQVSTVLIKSIDRKILKQESSQNVLRIKVLFATLLAMTITLLLGCLITTQDNMENWSFHTSIYFWFISTTTIGFGDIHFDRNKHLQSPHFLMLAAANLLFGLGIVAAVIEAFALALERHGEGIGAELAGQNVKDASLRGRSRNLPHLLRIIKDTDFIAKTVMVGGLALEINSRGRSARPKISQALTAGGFVYDNIGLRELPYEIDLSSIEEDTHADKSSSSSSSNTSYLHVQIDT